MEHNGGNAFLRGAMPLLEKTTRILQIVLQLGRTGFPTGTAVDLGCRSCTNFSDHGRIYSGD